MKIAHTLTKYKFPKEIRDIFSKEGLVNFYPPQAQAIEKGALEGKNLVLSVPTAAGKTLIAELCMLNAILHKKGRCLYIAPLKALVNEKHEDFKKKYSSLGIRVGSATGDLDLPEKYLSRYQIVVATAEKVDSLLRSKASWLINSLSVVVLDEIHFINDGVRGPTLEILSARIKQLNPDAQILALSATVSNASEIAKWLNGNLALSDWRPIPLKEGVYFNEKIDFHNSAAKIIKEEPNDDLGKIVLDSLRGQGQVLAFVNSRRSTQAASRQLCRTVAMTLKPEEKRTLTQIAKQIVGQGSDVTKICRTLAETVRHGVAFHHAGLKPRQRKLIEDNFKKNIIKVICSTPTLAAGVNLPARRTIIRDLKRFEAGLGSAYIPTSEYKQCAGRAGRPQYDKFGEAVLVAKTKAETKTFFDRYIKAKPEPVISKLGNESALRIHILASIAGDYVHDINDTFDFISHTFLAHQKSTRNLLHMIGNIFEFLNEEGFIEKKGFRYFATAFGRYTSRLYVDPLSSIIIRDGLKKVSAGKSFSHIGILHLICCCPDCVLIKNVRSQQDEIEIFASSCQDEFIMTKDDLPELNDFFFYIATMKTTLLYERWVNEEKEEMICDEFGIGPGDIYRHVETAQWLLYAGVVFADLFNFKNLTTFIEHIRQRVRYGIKEELIKLAQLKGIGRIRARLLFDKGIRSASDIKKIPLDDLAQISKIGKVLAKDIKNQALGKIDLKKVRAFSQEMLDMS